MRFFWLVGFFAGFCYASASRADYETARLIRDNRQALRTLGAHWALWVGDSRIVPDRARTQRLLNFAWQRGVDWLFVAAPSLTENDYGDWRIFIGEAHRNGIAVFAMAGNARWPLRPQLLQNHIRQVVRYQRTVNPGERFDGILYDLTAFFETLGVLTPDQLFRFPPGTEIETTVAGQEQPVPLQPQPPRTPEQLRGLLQFAEMAQRGREEVNRFRPTLRLPIPSLPRRLRLGFVLPPRLSDPITLNDAQEPFYRHILSASDFVVVRAYADQAQRIEAAIRDVLHDASQRGKGVLIALHTDHPGDYPLETTFFDEDQYRLEEEVNALIRSLRTVPSFAGIAIDHYTSYQRLPENRMLSPR